jgi:hypothetical protein
MLRSVFCVLLVLAWIAPLCAAPLGTAISYQGRLTDAGVPANGLFDIELCLYDDASGSAALVCAAPFDDVPVADGLFTVAPDFGAGWFLGETRYLELRVRAGASAGGYTALAPRQPLLPAPEALRAEVASAVPWNGLTGVPAGFADGSDDVGVGTVTNVASGFGLSGGPISSSGTLTVDPNVMQRRIVGNCSAAEVLRGVNADGTVSCGPDANSGGTVTAIAAGTGLSGGTIVNSGTLAIADGGVGVNQINSSEVQRRVTGSCSVGSTISAVNADGSVVCASSPRRAFTSTQATAGNGGGDLSIAVRADNRPLIVFHSPGGAGSGALKVLDCNSSYCEFGAERVVDPGGNVGWETRIALRSDGRPVIAYYDIANSALKVAVCASADCSGSATVTTVADHASDVVGLYIDLVITAGDRPALSYARFSADFSMGSVHYLRCSSSDCSGLQVPVTVSSTRARSFTGLVMAGTQPQIIFDQDTATPTIAVALCSTISCGTVTSVETVATLTAGPAGQGAGVGGDQYGRILLSYYDGANGDLRMLYCLNPGCPAGSNYDSLIASDGNVGWSSALAVAEGNLPVVVYYDVSTLQYKMLRCQNTSCTGGGTAIVLGSSPWAGQIGSENSLDIALATTGFPFAATTVLSATNVNMRTTKCESPDCR